MTDSGRPSAKLTAAMWSRDADSDSTVSEGPEARRRRQLSETRKPVADVPIQCGVRSSQKKRKRGAATAVTKAESAATSTNMLINGPVTLVAAKRTKRRGSLQKPSARNDIVEIPAVWKSSSDVAVLTRALFLLVEDKSFPQSVSLEICEGLSCGLHMIAESRNDLAVIALDAAMQFVRDQESSAQSEAKAASVDKKTLRERCADRTATLVGRWNETPAWRAFVQSDMDLAQSASDAALRALAVSFESGAVSDSLSSLSALAHVSAAVYDLCARVRVQVRHNALCAPMVDAVKAFQGQLERVEKKIIALRLRKPLKKGNADAVKKKKRLEELTQQSLELKKDLSEAQGALEQCVLKVSLLSQSALKVSLLSDSAEGKSRVEQLLRTRELQDMLLSHVERVLARFREGPQSNLPTVTTDEIDGMFAAPPPLYLDALMQSDGCESPTRASESWQVKHDAFFATTSVTAGLTKQDLPADLTATSGIGVFADDVDSACPDAGPPTLDKLEGTWNDANALNLWLFPTASVAQL